MDLNDHETVTVTLCTAAPISQKHNIAEQSWVQFRGMFTAIAHLMRVNQGDSEMGCKTRRAGGKGRKGDTSRVGSCWEEIDVKSLC